MVWEDKAKKVVPRGTDIMGMNLILPGVTLKAPPEIADNWKEGH